MITRFVKILCIVNFRVPPKRSGFVCALVCAKTISLIPERQMPVSITINFRVVFICHRCIMSEQLVELFFTQLI